MATIQPQRRSLAEIKSKLLNPATTSHFQVNIGTPSRSDGSFNRFLRETGLNYDQDQLNILCSDAFFPFRDSIDKIANTGIKAVIQPGGSMRDNEVISACNEHQIAMVFTGKRCFKH